MMILHCCVCDSFYGEVKNTEYISDRDYTSGFCPECWETQECSSHIKYTKRKDGIFWKIKVNRKEYFNK